MSSPVTIVGATGDLGFGLALRLAKAGVPVVIGSRDAGRAAEAAAARRARPCRAPTSRDSRTRTPSRGAELVVLSVPFASQALDAESRSETRSQPGTLLLDVTVPLAAAVGGRADARRWASRRAPPRSRRRSSCPPA